MKFLLNIALIAFVLTAVLLSVFRSSPAPVAASGGTTTVSPANPEQAAKCEKVLQYGQRMGAIKSYKGTADGYGTVIVGPSFYSATFENKQLLDATVRCVLSRGRADYGGLKYVGYYDLYNNKEIARWSSVTGFSVD